MASDLQESGALTALPTKLEEDFIAPLTAIRGVLEILRDFPDITPEEQTRFVENALTECTRIEVGLRDLGAAIYGADREQKAPRTSDRLRLDAANNIAELDFSGIDFDSAGAVNEMFDEIIDRVAATGQRWWFLVNYTDCHVFPEAWIAYAHRGKEIRVKYGYGTIRYASDDQGGLPDRARALAEIDRAKASVGR